MPKNIAIIGAGCAGLAAAATLLHLGGGKAKVTLFDASGRMGGRARTSTDPPGLPVDLGPQFIQDPAINPWYGIAGNLGYQPSDLVQQAMDAIYRVQQGEGWLNANGLGEIGAAESQLGKQYQIAAGFKNAPVMTGNSPAFLSGQQSLRLALGSSQYGPIVESADPWRYLVSDQDRQVSVNAGANVYVKGGLGKLVQTYGEQLAADNHNLTFEKNTIIESIQDGDKDVAIQTVGGEAPLSFDFCIVTIPCSEIEKIKFTPLLPGPRARADGFIRLGSYKKVAFRPTGFPEADNEDLEQSNSIEQNFEYYIYDRDRDGVWQYFRLPTDPSILICVTAGDFARALDDQADDKVAKAVIGLLADSYPTGNFKVLNNQIVVTNWTKTPYVHGAYSYTRYDDRLPPDDPVPFEARELIREPSGRIHFAGEATWVEAYGTIHGAYRSGQRAGEEILKIIEAG